MWQSALLVVAAILSICCARPQLKPLSRDMVDYINKVNTTWKVGNTFFHISSSTLLLKNTSLDFSLFALSLIFGALIVALCLLLFRRLATTSVTWTTAMSRSCVVHSSMDPNCPSCEAQCLHRVAL